MTHLDRTQAFALLQQLDGLSQSVARSVKTIPGRVAPDDEAAQAETKAIVESVIRVTRSEVDRAIKEVIGYVQADDDEPATMMAPLVMPSGLPVVPPSSPRVEPISKPSDGPVSPVDAGDPPPPPTEADRRGELPVLLGTMTGEVDVADDPTTTSRRLFKRTLLRSVETGQHKAVTGD